MPKVVKAFRERHHDMKLYKVDDDYPVDDNDRVKYLVSQGFLELDEQTDIPVSLTLDEFVALSATEQKETLTSLGIEGDDSNVEKRESLYAAYLEGVIVNGDS